MFFVKKFTFFGAFAFKVGIPKFPGFEPSYRYISNQHTI